MTHWSYNIDRTVGRCLAFGEQTCIVAWDKGNDYQSGDTIAFGGDCGGYAGGVWGITHVSKNQNGIADGYAVLSLKAPDADYYRDQAKKLTAEVNQLARSNASLRGQITKLRKRVTA